MQCCSGACRTLIVDPYGSCSTPPRSSPWRMHLVSRRERHDRKGIPRAQSFLWEQRLHLAFLAILVLAAREKKDRKETLRPAIAAAYT